MFAVQVLGNSLTQNDIKHQEQQFDTYVHTHTHALCVTLHQLLWALGAASSLTTQTHGKVTAAWVELAAGNRNTIIWQQIEDNY